MREGRTDSNILKGHAKEVLPRPTHFKSVSLRIRKVGIRPCLNPDSMRLKVAMTPVEPDAEKVWRLPSECIPHIETSPWIWYDTVRSGTNTAMASVWALEKGWGVAFGETGETHDLGIPKEGWGCWYLQSRYKAMVLHSPPSSGPHCHEGSSQSWNF